jgi:hypothetical protein
MANEINDIKAGIISRLAISIPTYSQLSYQVDVAQNKFKGNSKGFAVHPQSATETDSLVGAFTMDHTFSITLTNSYNEGSKSQIGDSLKSSRITELNDDILIAYKDLVNNKGNIDNTILVINDLNIEDAEFLEEEKVITVKFNVNIKYKINK